MDKGQVDKKTSKLKIITRKAAGRDKARLTKPACDKQI